MQTTAMAGDVAGDSDSGGSHILEEERWKRPLDNFGGNFWDSHFDSRALAFHLAAGAAAALLVESDADAKIQRWAAGHNKDISQAWSAPGVIGGAVAPVAVPGGLLFFSDDPRAQDAGAAAMQAAAIAFASSSFLKAATNRRSPEEGKKATNKDARDFRSGVQSPFGGGFPSAHAATNMAMSAALAACHPDNPAVRAAAYGWAGYVAASMALGDQGGLHWTSDVVAGGVMGWVIGDTVGRRCGEQSSSQTARRVQLAADLPNNGLQLVIRL